MGKGTVLTRISLHHHYNHREILEYYIFLVKSDASYLGTTRIMRNTLMTDRLVSKVDFPLKRQIFFISIDIGEN